MSARDLAPEAPALRLLEMINANWMTQAIGAAAELGIADALAADASDSAGLASRLGCAPDSLDRLMRGLEGLALFERDAEGRWQATPLGALLQRDREGGIRSWAIYSALHSWTVWGHLLDCVRSGRSARDLLAGQAGYDHLEAEPRTAAVFHQAMEEITRLVAPAVAGHPWFTGMREIVDVGGGHGTLLAAVLRARPGLRGIVFDLPHAVQGAEGLLAANGVGDRARVETGSFFERVPGGADGYLLKSIVHNWDDAHAVAILRRCREAGAPGAAVILVERILPLRGAEGTVDRLTLRSDLNMLVGLGGRERTAAHMGELMQAAGFTLREIAPAGYGFALLRGD